MSGELQQCAADIAMAVMSDTGVGGIFFEICQALSQDVSNGAPLPDAETIDTLVMGDDEGNIPEELSKQYANLCFLLDKECT
jgi:hypothetical protein